MSKEDQANQETNIQGNVTGSAVDGGTVNARNIAGRDIHEHHYGERDIQYPVVNLPLANPHFVGREAHLAMLTAAPAGSAMAITLTIAGLGGVGKSQMMLHFAHQQRSQNAYDIIWWLRVDEALAEDFLALGRQLGRNWLNGTDKRWLLLCDNADEMKPRTLREFLSQNLQGRILITSRNRHWLNLGEVLRLDVFTPPEAAQFWRERLGAGDNSARTNLAETVGYLPLAMTHAAAYMAENELDAAGYLRLYRARRQELWQDTEPPDDYPSTITTTWEIGFAKARQTPGAANLLNFCCFLAPDDIPLALLVDHADALPDKIAAVLSDDLARNAALRSLERYSLVERGDDLLSIHRLVQTIARDQMKADMRVVWRKTAINFALHVFPDDKNIFHHTWEASKQYLPHACTTAKLALENSQDLEITARLCHDISYYLKTTGNNKGALWFCQRALAIRERILGSEHCDTAESLNMMGRLVGIVTGDHKQALIYTEKALTIRKRVLGFDHPDTAESLNNIGYRLRKMGHFEKAKEYIERALEIREHVLGPEHPDVAFSLNNMGMMYQAMGDFTKALPFYKRALQIRIHVLGSDHPLSATLYSNIGSVLRELGDLEEAQLYTKQALAIRERKLGSNHPETAHSLHRLAVLYIDEEHFNKAKQSLQRALIIQEKSYGFNHPETIKSRELLMDINAKLN